MTMANLAGNKAPGRRKGYRQPSSYQELCSISGTTGSRHAAAANMQPDRDQPSENQTPHPISQETLGQCLPEAFRHLFPQCLVAEGDEHSPDLWRDWIRTSSSRDQGPRSNQVDRSTLTPWSVFPPPATLLPALRLSRYHLGAAWSLKVVRAAQLSDIGQLRSPETVAVAAPSCCITSSARTNITSMPC